MPTLVPGADSLVRNRTCCQFGGAVIFVPGDRSPKPLGAFENSGHRIVIGCRNGIKLVVMIAGASHCGSEKTSGRRVDLLVDQAHRKGRWIFLVLFLRAHRAEAGRDEKFLSLFVRRCFHEVASEVLATFCIAVLATFCVSQQGESRNSFTNPGFFLLCEFERLFYFWLLPPSQPMPKAKESRNGSSPMRMEMVSSQRMRPRA